LSSIASYVEDSAGQRHAADAIINRVNTRDDLSMPVHHASSMTYERIMQLEIRERSRSVRSSGMHVRPEGISSEEQLVDAFFVSCQPLVDVREDWKRFRVHRKDALSQKKRKEIELFGKPRSMSRLASAPLTTLDSLATFAASIRTS
jgi:hypothetical protein